MFQSLGKIWSGFRDSMVYLSMITNLLNSLQPFSVRRQLRLSERYMRILINDPEIVWDDMRKVGAPA